MAREIMRMSAEESARWLSNPESEPWLSHITDPELKEKFRRQQVALKDAIYDFAFHTVEALRVESPTTAERLDDLRQRKDPRSQKLMLTMLYELMNTAFVDLR